MNQVAKLTNHHIIARSSGGGDEEGNILPIPSDFHNEINRCHREGIRKAKEAGRPVRDIVPPTIGALELGIREPIERSAGSVRTNALIKVAPFTIHLQLDAKDQWDTHRYPRVVEKNAGTYMVHGSPGGYSWFCRLQTRGPAAYRSLREL